MIEVGKTIMAVSGILAVITVNYSFIITLLCGLGIAITGLLIKTFSQ